jgi:hypothetical protein
MKRLYTLGPFTGYLRTPGQADRLLGRILEIVKGMQGKPTLSNLYSVSLVKYIIFRN